MGVGLANDFNLNLPRYIDSSEPEDLQDIDGHLRGGIPNRDIDALDRYWQVIPGVRSALFKKGARAGYSQLRVATQSIKTTIFDHEEFTAFNTTATKLFTKWKKANASQLNDFAKNGHPKRLDPYDIYQHLMDYWAETMQDDCYLVASDGWRKAAEPRLIIEDKNKKNKVKLKPDLVVGKKKYLTEPKPPNWAASCCPIAVVPHRNAADPSIRRART